ASGPMLVGMCRRWPVVVLLALTLAAAAACKEGDEVTVNSLSFKGVTSVDVSLLKSVLATREDTKVPVLSSRLPWSRQRRAFDQTRLDADVKRIEAYYADRGFPDARVTAVDARMSSRSKAVDITVTVAEGEPVRVSAVELRGFDVVPPDHLADLQKQLPLVAG